MNTFLYSLSASWRNLLYYGFHIIGCLVAAVFITLRSVRLHATRKQMLALLATALVIYGTMFIWQYAEYPFTHVFHRDSAKSLLLVPFYILIASRVSRSDYDENLGIIAPAFVIGRGFGVLGCIFPGCCEGLPVDHGLYSSIQERVVFPVQLLEFLLSVLLFIILLLLSRTKAFSAGKRLFGITAIMFGYMRYFTDVFRVNRKLFFFSSLDGVYAFLMIAMGLLMLYLSELHSFRNQSSFNTPAYQDR